MDQRDNFMMLVYKNVYFKPLYYRYTATANYMICKMETGGTLYFNIEFNLIIM